MSIIVNVIDRHFVLTCPGEKHLEVLWPETAPGTENVQECPSPSYTGTARRRCSVQGDHEPVWQIPDYSHCISEKLIQTDINVNVSIYIKNILFLF